ncbi:MAG: ClcB-like voltage-gated chloride channel protein [Betaproteobacteria bacterium]|nr:ClcB-like voltage-gated chloride channel protein [Betaproteobacteria bacterium]
MPEPDEAGHYKPGLRARLQRWWLLGIERFGTEGSHIDLVWAAVLGFTGAVATIAFREGIHLFQLLLSEHSTSLVETARSLAWWQRLILPAGGGMAAGLTLQAARRFIGAHTASDYMEAIVIGDGRIPIRESLARSLSSLASVASGGSIGREGSMVQLAAVTASMLGRTSSQSGPRLRLLVACGAAAGITAAYSAPIAGALFISEIVLGSIAMDTFGPLLVAAVVSNVSMRALTDYGAPYQMPPFPVIAGREMWLFVGLGVVAGAAAPLFLGFLDNAKRAFARVPLPLALRMGIGGLIVGGISVYVPEVWGNGYSVVNSLLHHEWLWPAVLILLLAKIVATAATMGSGAVGGIFTPMLFFGAALGLLFGQAAHAAWPAVTSQPFAYAIVGMGALLAAGTRAPLMAILMIFEMTLSYEAVLPLMLSCVVAYFVARTSGGMPMYSAVSHREKGSGTQGAWQSLEIAQLIKTTQPCVGIDARFADIRRAFVEHPVRFLYVLDGDGMFRGVISLHDVNQHLLGGGPPGEPGARELLRTDMPLLTPQMKLGDALQKFFAHQGERLPVVASLEQPRFIGAVSKTDLLMQIQSAAAG